MIRRLWCRRCALTVTIGVLAVVSACSGTSASATSLTIYAAASLKAALTKADATYQAARPGLTITLSTDSSAALETQIEQGAPADLFLSADASDPQKLVDKGLAAGSMTVFARNHLTIIVPKADPAGISTPLDLVRPGVKIIAAGPEVPITRYATQLVARLAKQPGYPADFAAEYAAHVVSQEINVSALVAKVGLGEGDAGICYVTDAKTSDDVATVDVPDAANVPATYGGVVVKASASQAAAQAFLTWLAGSDGQAILASFGFLPPAS
ncbi:MAG TPA: molybdate ABC transporter substrate-binding protein [Candidatus Limnocylindrales bacterium]|nr:molybdate ABC transporter substrate-binding protein [Candidatus Limnocylindrales bacterium]